MLPLETKKIAKGYTRVSTNTQKEDGVSLETQYFQIKAYCTYKNLELVKVYEDAGISGKNMIERPALLEMLKDIQEGDYIIFADLSRIARDTKDMIIIHETITAKKANMVCLSPDIDMSTPAGEMMMKVLATLHQYERQMTSQKVSDNLKRISVEGKLRSKPPFGWKNVGKDKDFEEVPEQQLVIKYCIEAHKVGHSFYKISEYLNSHGFAQVFNLNKKKPCKNPQFRCNVVRRILIDAGSIEDPERKLVETRILSHHKT